MAKTNKPPLSGDLLSPGDLDAMVDDVLAMEAYCQAFRKLVQKRLEQGEIFERASLEPKRPMPKWVDEAKVLTMIAKARLLPVDTYAPRKVMPPGAFKKAVAAELKKDEVRKPVRKILDMIETKSSGFNLKLR